MYTESCYNPRESNIISFFLQTEPLIPCETYIRVLKNSRCIKARLSNMMKKKWWKLKAKEKLKCFWPFGAKLKHRFLRVLPNCTNIEWGLTYHMSLSWFKVVNSYHVPNDFFQVISLPASSCFPPFCQLHHLHSFPHIFWPKWAYHETCFSLKPCVILRRHVVALCTSNFATT